MNNPLISVIMPAYNAEMYIEESISSVIAQTYTDWELLVIDDGSSDGTGYIVKNIIETDNRVRYICQDNAKQGAARNNGIAHSKGDYISFLDADDIWHPEKLKLQLSTLIREQVDLVFSDCEIFHDKYVKGISYPLYESCKGKIDASNGLHDILIRNYVPILTVLVTRSSLNRVGHFSTNSSIQNAEDYHLWLKLMLTGYVFYGMNEVLAAYRVHVKAATGINKSGIDWILYAKYDILKKFPKYRYLLQNNIWSTILLKIKEGKKSGRYLCDDIIAGLEFFNLSLFKQYFIFLKSKNLFRIANSSFNLFYLNRKLLQRISGI